MTRLTADLVLSLTDRVSGPARGVERSMERLQRQALQTRRLTGAEAVAMGKANATLLASAAGSAAILGPAAAAFVGQKIVSTAADFESALTNIQKKAGASAEQTAALGEEIKALAISGDLAVPIEEIAAAYERGAAAGIPLGELREFASLSAKAADAFEMSSTDVGNAAAGFNKVLGIPMKGMERYFDLINGLADSGIADEIDIVQFVDQAGAMSKTFGLSAEETAAFGSALANLKVPAAKAATAMNSIFTRLLAPDELSGDAREAYYRLIKDDKKFKKQLESGEADEAFVGMVDALRAMDTETRTGTIFRLFGQDHLDVMTQLVEGADELKRNLAYANDEGKWLGSLNNSYKLKLDDFWSQWQLVKNALAELTIDTGTMGMPAFKAALEGAQALIAEIDNGLARFKATVDVTEVERAGQAIGELGTTIQTLTGMGGSDESAIMKFFNRLANTANTVTAAINLSKDALQAVGLVEADSDTAEVRKGRRDAFFDGFEEFNPAVGPAINDAYKWATRSPEETADQNDDARRRWNESFARSGQAYSQPVEIDQPRAKTGRIPGPNRADSFDARYSGGETPELTGLQGSVNALSAAMVDLASRRGAAVATTSALGLADSPTAAPSGAIAVPTPRPDIVGPLSEEGDRATLKAQEIGQRIQQAASVTVTPTVNTSSIDAAQAKADRLKSTLQELSAMSRGLGGGGGRGGASVDGVHADTTYPGY